MTDMNKAFELIREYRGAANIPANVLSENGLMLVAQGSGVRIVVQDDLDRTKSEIGKILRTYRGYIGPMDFQILLEMARGERSWNGEHVSRMTGRSRAFKEAGIPPIYDTRFFGRATGAIVIDNERVVGSVHRFPVVDFIIQFSVGVLEQRRMARMANANTVMGKAARESKIAMWSCTVQDVKAFCDSAFDANGSILLPLIREIHHHTRTRFEFQTDAHEAYALQHTDRTLVFLEEILRPIALRTPRADIQWDGDISIVQEPRWYFGIVPSQHDVVARAYFDSIKTVPAGDERAVYQRMCDTFPHLASRLWVRGMARANLGDAIDFALEKNDYLLLPAELFTEGYADDRIRTAALTHLRAARDRWIDTRDLTVFNPISSLLRSLCLPSTTAQEPAFKDAIADARLGVAKSMTDEQFVSLFSKKNGHLDPSQFVQQGDSVSLEQLRAYLRERSRLIRAA